MDEVASLVHLHRETIRRMVNAGEFPAPVYVSKRSPRWRRADVEAWLAKRRT